MFPSGIVALLASTKWYQVEVSCYVFRTLKLNKHSPLVTSLPNVKQLINLTYLGSTYFPAYRYLCFHLALLAAQHFVHARFYYRHAFISVCA